jgi:hypothetical protein
MVLQIFRTAGISRGEDIAQEGIRASGRIRAELGHPRRVNFAGTIRERDVVPGDRSVDGYMS